MAREVGAMFLQEDAPGFFAMMICVLASFLLLSNRGQGEHDCDNKYWFESIVSCPIFVELIMIPNKGEVSTRRMDCYFLFLSYLFDFLVFFQNTAE